MVVPNTPLDRAWRIALWLAYRILRLWWRIAKPQHRGAVIAVWLGPQILLIRHSYRDRLSWPGGGINRGETPEAAARRELKEELGLEAPEAALAFRAAVLERWERRYDHVHIFELRLAALPELRPDGREVVGALFMDPAQALAQPLVPFVEAYLRQYGPPTVLTPIKLA